MVRRLRSEVASTPHAHAEARNWNEKLHFRLLFFSRARGSAHANFPRAQRHERRRAQGGTQVSRTPREVGCGTSRAPGSTFSIPLRQNVVLALPMRTWKHVGRVVSSMSIIGIPCACRGGTALEQKQPAQRECFPRARGSTYCDIPRLMGVVFFTRTRRHG